MTVPKFIRGSLGEIGGFVETMRKLLLSGVGGMGGSPSICGGREPPPQRKKNVKQLVVATSQKKGEQRPKLGAETLWFPWCLQFVPLELDYEKVEIHRYLQWFCACTA